METGTEAVAQFKEQVTRLGGHFASLPDLQAAAKYLTELALAAGVKRIVLCGAELSARLFPSASKLPFEVAASSRMGRVDFFDALKSAEMGISPVDLGVAEAGTLVIATSEESDRLVTALPLIHVAILPKSRLVSSFKDAEPFLAGLLTKSPEPLSISLISASSRTSDVGGIIILGVHGPRELHVLLLDEEFAGGS